MPIRPKYGSPGLTADRESRAREAALAESGRDPFAEALQALIPINRATTVAKQEGRLAGLAELTRAMLMGRGTVVNPTHRDFLRTVQSDPRAAGALMRAPERHGFASIPESSFSPGVLGVTAPRALGIDEVAHPMMSGLAAGPRTAEILQGLSPFLRKIPGYDRQTRLHELLHALRYGQQQRRGEPLTGLIEPGAAKQILELRKSQGFEQLAAHANDPGHAALDAMAWNIRRKNP